MRASLARTAGRATLALLLAGCGSWSRVGSHPQPDEGQTLAQILDATATYKRLGRLAAGAPIPFVGSVSFLAGAGDSTLAILALSLENSHLAFHREGGEFVARYRVQFTAEGAERRAERSREQVVRVATFQETQRAEESVLYQDAVALPPGRVRVTVTLTDLSNRKSSTVSGEYEVPAFGPGTFSAPVLAYQVRGRAARTEPLSLIVNPRGTVAYGRDTALAYVEGYLLPGPRAIPIRLVDARDSVILSDTLHFQGRREVESLVLRFRPETAPLGELRILAGEGPEQRATSALVSFSPNWVVTNFDEMLSLLRYFPSSAVLDSLRKAPPGERARLWSAFWRESDPNPASPENEALAEYFSRLALANARFRDEGVPGWRTDRGEVLIRLGEPDEIFDASPQSQGRLIRWGYTRYQLYLFFVDETGFGRYRLTPASRSEFERVMARVSRQAE
ncbi:MAG TPA: GWxTD domain-containing protein [Gemmatimonadales bacterium]|nr:GWxTD domain-containing protein [Gemmatimonadales bacterium]